MERPQRFAYVYRLIVTLPEGSDAPGWEPPGWNPPWSGDPDESTAFRWPALRDYLSQSGAENRAKLFRQYGAEVEVRRSRPVTW